MFSLLFLVLGEPRQGAPPGGAPVSTLSGAANPPPENSEGDTLNLVRAPSRGKKPRGVQGCWEACCACVLLVLEGCARAGEAPGSRQSQRRRFAARSGPRRGPAPGEVPDCAFK